MEGYNIQPDMEHLAQQYKENEDRSQRHNIIMAIGVGGGGGNAVNHMFNQGVEKVTFVVCNTDADAVRQSPVPNKVVIGDGRGAGNKPERARLFAEADIEKIEGIFDDETQMVFITAGMGGGTGTGAAPVVARVAKERGLLTIGIVTIPFMFEGKKKILKALEGAEEMKNYVDALLIINNERLSEIYGDLDFFNAFGKADDTLSNAARSISEIITTQGYINLDFNDVDTTLRDGGTAIISTGYGEGEGRITKAIEDALNSPLLKHRDIYGSQRLLMNIYMSRNGESNTMSMNETNEIKSFVASIDENVDVIWGVSEDNTLGDRVKITILASGFEVTIQEEEAEFGLQIDNWVKPGDKTQPMVENKPEQPKTTPKSNLEERMKREYGGGLNELSTNYIILRPDQMDDDAVMEVLERSAAYNRNRRDVDQLKGSSSTQSAPADARPTTHTSTPTGGMKIDF